MIEINGRLYGYSLKFKTTAKRRRISLVDVESTVQKPDEVAASEHDPKNRRLYRKLTDNRWVTVVVDENMLMLITVWVSDE